MKSICSALLLMSVFALTACSPGESPKTSGDSNEKQVVTDDELPLNQLCLNQMQGAWLNTTAVYNGDEYDSGWVRGINTVTTIDGRTLSTQAPEELPVTSEILDVTADRGTCLVYQVMTSSIYHEGLFQPLRITFSYEGKMLLLYGKFSNDLAGAQKQSIPLEMKADVGTYLTLAGFEKITDPEQ